MPPNIKKHNIRFMPLLTFIFQDSVFMQLARQKCPGSYYLYFHNLERDTLNDHEWKRFLQRKIKAQHKADKY